RAGRRQAPVEQPAERDEADAVLLLEIARRQRRRGAKREVESRLAVTRGLREGIEEEQHVGVSLRLLLVHPELAAARRRTPVHVAHAVAGNEQPQVGELDPLTALPGDVVAAEYLRLERPQQIADRLLARIHLERRAAVGDPLPREEVELVTRTQEDTSDHVAAPSLAMQAKIERAAGIVGERERRRIRSVGEADPARQLEQQLEPRDTVLGSQVDGGVHVLILEPTLVVKLEADFDLRPPREQERHGRQQSER